MVTLKDCKMYRRLQNSIHTLEVELTKERGKQFYETVMASRAELPYNLGCVTVSGISARVFELEKEISDARQKTQDVEEFIKRIDDPVTKQIFTLAFVYGHTYDQIAGMFGYEGKQGVGMAITRFFEKS